MQKLIISSRSHQVPSPCPVVDRVAVTLCRRRYQRPSLSPVYIARTTRHRLSQFYDDDIVEPSTTGQIQDCDLCLKTYATRFYLSFLIIFL
ncbi:unnamed protein product [Lactuca virosa]|uniref:Uncharacterized protein n=1 Tax=Lactuca virosa TaxID=75947 RepID=A0AAU9MHJ7_9ASTR|nr:unnamed protein product [Lactuca virosa]